MTQNSVNHSGGEGPDILNNIFSYAINLGRQIFPALALALILARYRYATYPLYVDIPFLAILALIDFRRSIFDTLITPPSFYRWIILLAFIAPCLYAAMNASVYPTRMQLITFFLAFILVIDIFTGIGIYRIMKFTAFRSTTINNFINLPISVLIYKFLCAVAVLISTGLMSLKAKIPFNFFALAAGCLLLHPGSLIVRRYSAAEPEFHQLKRNDGDCKLVFCVIKDLKMSTGKIAAQCAHAAIESYIQAVELENVYLKSWLASGQKKITLRITSEEVPTLKRQAEAAKIATCVIHDAGHTQVPSGTLTVLAIGPGLSSNIDKVCQHLKLL